VGQSQHSSVPNEIQGAEKLLLVVKVKRWSSQRKMAHAELPGRSCFADGPLDKLCWTKRMWSKMPGPNWLPFASVTSERASMFM
jgi:hypothetical protein